MRSSGVGMSCWTTGRDTGVVGTWRVASGAQPAAAIRAVNAVSFPNRPRKKVTGGVRRGDRSVFMADMLSLCFSGRPRRMGRFSKGFTLASFTLTEPTPIALWLHSLDRAAGISRSADGPRGPNAARAL